MGRLLATLALLGSASLSLAQMPQKGLVHLMTLSQGETVVDYFIAEAVALKQPKWAPTQSAPPLTAADAIAKGRNWLKDKHRKFDAFAPEDICYRQARDGRITFWYYAIRFNGMLGGVQVSGPTLMTVILFDGTVVEPKPGAPRR